MKVTASIAAFLKSERDKHNGQDLLDFYLDHPGLETQVNVAAGDEGRPVPGQRSTFTDGLNEWWNIRIPKHADSDPEFKDYELKYPLELHADSIGSTGWDWRARLSLYVGFDFDAIAGHAAGVGVTAEKLAEVKQAACNLPYVQVRRSTGGGGLHLYVFFGNGVETSNHTEHAALARCVLGLMSAEAGFNFAAQIDACGGNMWLWARKSTPENKGLQLLKPAQQPLTEIPSNWRDHVDVVTRKRAKIRVGGLSDQNVDIFEALSSAHRVVPLEQAHKDHIDAILAAGFSAVWISDHNMLHTHTKGFRALMENHREEFNLQGFFETNSPGANPEQPNCLSGDTVVITRTGLKTIKELAGKAHEIITSRGKWVTAPFKSYGVQPVFAITLKNGSNTKVIKATADHRWFVCNQLWGGKSKLNLGDRREVTTAELKENQVLVTTQPRLLVSPSVVGVQHGLVWGDGTNGGSRITSSLPLFGDKVSLLKFFHEHPRRALENTGVEVHNLPHHFKSLVPLTYDKPYLYGWLMGYFATDGCVDEKGNCCVNSASVESLEHVKDVCAILGIRTSPIRKMSDSEGRYKDTPCYKLGISRGDVTPNFFLLNKHKERALSIERQNNRYWRIVSVQPCGVEEVFCCTVQDTGQFVLEDFILTGNCFAFPGDFGSWKIYRFSPGISEAKTWEQDGQGYTTCWFNRRANLRMATRALGGKDLKRGGYEFESLTQAAEVAAALGSPIEIDARLQTRKAVVSKSKDGRLAIEVPKNSDDGGEMGDWNSSDKKNAWTQVFDVPTEPVKEEIADFDNRVRALKTVAGDEAGWAILEDNGEWKRSSYSNVKVVLQSYGLAKEEAEIVMGTANRRTWKLVSLPFQPEYPGNRQWNLDAPQFAYTPLARGEDISHPTWDLVLDHVGQDLDSAIKDLEWARRANICTGSDYLRAWYSCIIKEPNLRLPYLFLFGDENCGKSILWEAFQLLVTQGVVKADRSLTNQSDFNGELVGAILCVVEEKDISKSAGALAKIKDAVTSLMLSIRKMRTDTFQIPNLSHWIQCANHQDALIVPSGDTRITVIYVHPLQNEIPKDELIRRLQREAPAFLRTLLDMQLPPPQGRLGLPLVGTRHKARSEELSRSPLESFIRDFCHFVIGETIAFAEFYERFIESLMDDRHSWTKQKVSRSLPVNHPSGAGTGNKKFVANVSWEPKEPAPDAKLLIIKDGKLVRDG